MHIVQMWSLTSLASLLLLKHAYATCQNFVIPNTPFEGNVVSEGVSLPDKFDGQKVTPYPNASSWEWWYFDAYATDSSAALSVIFLQSTNVAFSSFGGADDQFLWLSIAGTWENGTIFLRPTPVGNSSTDLVHITTEGDGASGVWGKTGFSFQGTHDLSEYTVNLESPTGDLTGSMTFQSVSPPHFPCGPRTAVANELLFPNIGWVNAIPDANAVVDITFNGTRLAFQGYGYHDKNWGDAPFTDIVQSWYWGHGRLGPYSLVWFDALGVDGDNPVSVWVTEGDRVIAGSCSPGSARIRPWGENSEYPPRPATGTPQGYDMVFDLGDTGEMVIRATINTVLLPSPRVVPPGTNSTYGRYLGTLEGSFGGQNYTGTGLWEQFKY